MDSKAELTMTTSLKEHNFSYLHSQYLIVYETNRYTSHHPSVKLLFSINEVYYTGGQTVKNN